MERKLDDATIKQYVRHLLKNSEYGPDGPQIHMGASMSPHAWYIREECGLAEVMDRQYRNYPITKEEEQLLEGASSEFLNQIEPAWRRAHSRRFWRRFFILCVIVVVVYCVVRAI